MKSITLLCYLFLFGLVCTAQSIENRYSSFITENNVLFFLRPVKLNQTINMHNFEYDVTYSEKQDSANLNFTIYIDVIAKIDSLRIISDKTEIVDTNPRYLFHDITKSSLKVRTSAQISFNDMSILFRSDHPITFHIYLSDGTECFATYKVRKWRKEREMVSRIIQSSIM